MLDTNFVFKAAEAKLRGSIQVSSSPQVCSEVHSEQVRGLREETEMMTILRDAKCPHCWSSSDRMFLSGLNKSWNPAALLSGGRQMDSSVKQSHQVGQSVLSSHGINQVDGSPADIKRRNR